MANVISPRDREQRLAAIYGPGFPDPERHEGQELAAKYLTWMRGQMDRQRSSMRDKRLHWSRHRLFRQGRQWISSRDGTHWREVDADQNRVRAVFDMVGPALAFRLGLLQEQRPGFKHTPLAGQGVRGREIAEAQQSVVEWHFYGQKMWPLLIDAMMHAQTDGVSWLNVYVDREGGPQLSEDDVVSPDDRRYEELAREGYAHDDDGRLIVPGGRSFSSGEIRTRLILAHETYADPEARTINGADRRAKWFIVRRLRDLQSVQIQLGDPELESESDARQGDPLDLASLELRPQWQRGLPPFPSSRLELNQGGVWEQLAYIAKSPEVPEGLWVELLTERHMRSGSLPGGVIPIARMTDGSSDDELYPRPIMSDWIGHQTSINALGSKLLEIARASSGSHVLALKGTQITESYTDIVGSFMEYEGMKPEVIQGTQAGRDLWELWVHMIRQLEDKTGWTSLARGQLTGEGGFQDIAGRAVLAARELFERQFGPMIRAAATGTSEWAELVVKYAQYLYVTPRLVPMAGRPDLAKRIASSDLEGDANVYVEPETLQPLPRALRNQLLYDYLQAGLISVDEFRKRAPFAEVRDLNMGDVDQWRRAQQLNAILEDRWEELAKLDAEELYDPSTGVGLYWQDDPKVFMKALEELILDDTRPFALRKLATDIWGIYEELAMSKGFPPELELQGMPRPPAPAELLGVPNRVSQLSEPRVQSMVSPSDVPGGQPGAAPAPEMSGVGVPSASTEQAQPLGTVGQAEAGLPQ